MSYSETWVDIHVSRRAGMIGRRARQIDVAEQAPCHGEVPDSSKGPSGAHWWRVDGAETIIFSIPVSCYTSLQLTNVLVYGD